MSKRKIDVVVISDVHLGTFGCRAKELCAYLSSIDPDIIILNGDIIDIWQFNKNYWPKSHMKVVKKIISFLAKGKIVYYIAGNHDEMLRKFIPFKLSHFSIANKLVLNIEGKKTWIFHGDIFDITMKHSKWLAKLGAVGYDGLILLNAFMNWMSEKCGYGKISLSKRIKNGVKSAIAFIDNFEETAAEIAIEQKYDTVICGHIHQPAKKIIRTKSGQVQYLNSGDWIENLTALEFFDKQWHLHTHVSSVETEEEDETMLSPFNNFEDILMYVVKDSADELNIIHTQQL